LTNYYFLIIDLKLVNIYVCIQASTNLIIMKFFYHLKSNQYLNNQKLSNLIMFLLMIAKFAFFIFF